MAAYCSTQVPVKTGGFSQRLWMLDQLEPKTLASVTGGASVFSPDSQWVCFIDRAVRDHPPGCPQRRRAPHGDPL